MPSKTMTRERSRIFFNRVSYFFFQAEDGIRDTSVTGVQTCALPISIIVVVVVLPWLPATATPSLTRISSPSISARGMTGMFRARAAAISGLSGRTALDKIGRASCRERGGGQEVAVVVKKVKRKHRHR